MAIIEQSDVILAGPGPSIYLELKEVLASLDMNISNQNSSKYRCPNCGASKHIHEKCEYCGR